MSIIDDLQKKEKALQNLIRLGSLTVLPLHADFNHASSQWRRDRSSQFWARTTIRCLSSRTVSSTPRESHRRTQQTECVTNPLTRQQLFLRKFSLSPELEPLISTFFRAFSSVRFDRFSAFSRLL